MFEGENVAGLVAKPIAELGARKPVCLKLGSPLHHALELMRLKHLGCILVVDESDILKGIVTERDFTMRLVGQNIDLDSTPIETLMTSDPETLHAMHPIVYALNRMALGGYRHVPLINQKGQPVGIVSVKDIVQYLVDAIPDIIYNLPPEPEVYGDKAEGG